MCLISFFLAFFSSVDNLRVIVSNKSFLKLLASSPFKIGVFCIGRAIVVTPFEIIGYNASNISILSVQSDLTEYYVTKIRIINAKNNTYLIHIIITCLLLILLCLVIYLAANKDISRSINPFLSELTIPLNKSPVPRAISHLVRNLVGLAGGGVFPKGKR